MVVVSKGYRLVENYRFPLSIYWGVPIRCLATYAPTGCVRRRMMLVEYRASILQSQSSSVLHNPVSAEHMCRAKLAIKPDNAGCVFFSMNVMGLLESEVLRDKGGRQMIVYHISKRFT